MANFPRGGGLAESNRPTDPSSDAHPSAVAVGRYTGRRSPGGRVRNVPERRSGRGCSERSCALGILALVQHSWQHSSLRLTLFRGISQSAVTREEK